MYEIAQKIAFSQPEYSEVMAYDHIKLLAGILEIGANDYPVLANESWVMEQVNQSFSGQGTLKSSYENPAFAYLLAAITAASIVEFN